MENSKRPSFGTLKTAIQMKNAEAAQKRAEEPSFNDSFKQLSGMSLSALMPTRDTIIVLSTAVKDEFLNCAKAISDCTSAISNCTSAVSNAVTKTYFNEKISSYVSKTFLDEKLSNYVSAAANDAKWADLYRNLENYVQLSANPVLWDDLEEELPAILSGYMPADADVVSSGALAEALASYAKTQELADGLQAVKDEIAPILSNKADIDSVPTRPSDIGAQPAGDYATVDSLSVYAKKDDVMPLQFRAWYPDGSVTDESQFTTLKYDWENADTVNHTVKVLAFAGDGQHESNIDAMEDVVVPPYVDHDGERYTVVAIEKCLIEEHMPAQGGVLMSIIIPTTVTEIEAGAFYGCIFLESIIIPNSVTSIGDYAFEACAALPSIALPNSVSSIGKFAFHDCNDLATVILPGSINNIGPTVFDYCLGLRSIKIPDSVTSIGAAAFRGCDKLKSIVIPNSVSSIGHEAFNGCRALTSITIPDSVITIGSAAFFNCSALTSAMINNGVSGIEYSAFEECSNLEEINFGSKAFQTIPTCKNNSFSNIPTTCKFIIPDDNYDEWVAAANWSSLVAAGYEFIKYSQWEAPHRYELNDRFSYLDEINGVLVLSSDGNVYINSTGDIIFRKNLSGITRRDGEEEENEVFSVIEQLRKMHDVENICLPLSGGIINVVDGLSTLTEKKIKEHTYTFDATLRVLAPLDQPIPWKEYRWKSGGGEQVYWSGDFNDAFLESELASHGLSHENVEELLLSADYVPLTDTFTLILSGDNDFKIGMSALLSAHNSNQLFDIGKVDSVTSNSYPDLGYNSKRVGTVRQVSDRTNVQNWHTLPWGERWTNGFYDFIQTDTEIHFDHVTGQESTDSITYFAPDPTRDPFYPSGEPHVTIYENDITPGFIERTQVTAERVMTDANLREINAEFEKNDVFIRTLSANVKYLSSEISALPKSFVTHEQLEETAASISANCATAEQIQSINNAIYEIQTETLTQFATTEFVNSVTNSIYDAIADVPTTEYIDNAIVQEISNNAVTTQRFNQTVSSISDAVHSVNNRVSSVSEAVHYVNDSLSSAVSNMVSRELFDNTVSRLMGIIDELSAKLQAVIDHQPIEPPEPTEELSGTFTWTDEEGEHTEYLSALNSFTWTNADGAHYYCPEHGVDNPACPEYQELISGGGETGGRMVWRNADGVHEITGPVTLTWTDSEGRHAVNI